MIKKSMCRHCGKEVVSRPRGLGWRCYYTPGIQALYPIKAVDSNNRGVDTPTRLPEKPTSLPPGPERIPVYRARLERGEHWQHPRDGEQA